MLHEFGTPMTGMQVHGGKRNHDSNMTHMGNMANKHEYPRSLTWQAWSNSMDDKHEIPCVASMGWPIGLANFFQLASIIPSSAWACEHGTRLPAVCWTFSIQSGLYPALPGLYPGWRMEFGPPSPRWTPKSWFVQDSPPMAARARVRQQECQLWAAIHQTNPGSPSFYQLWGWLLLIFQGATTELFPSHHRHPPPGPWQRGAPSSHSRWWRNHQHNTKHPWLDQNLPRCQAAPNSPEASQACPLLQRDGKARWPTNMKPFYTDTHVLGTNTAANKTILHGMHWQWHDKHATCGIKH